MIRTEPNAFRSLLIALATALLLAGATAFAEHQIQLDAGAMPIEDEDGDPLDEVGVDLTCAGGLTIVVTAEDGGGLGNVTLDSYAVDGLREDALERVFATEAAFRMGVFTPAISGLVVEVDDVSRSELLDRAIHRLEATGCRVGDAIAGDYGFTFADGHGGTFTATFGATSEGARLYLGH